MIAWLVAKLVARGVASDVAPKIAMRILVAIAIPLTAGAIFGGVKLWFYFHDRGVIQNYENGVTAEVTRRELTSERAANAEDVRIEQRNRARSEHLEREINNAVTEYPEQSAQPVGPATAAVLDSLRIGDVDPPDASGNDSAGAD
ncbi:MAG: hypothetical protein E6G92_04265 [Alphaproteobacteria bacterium]|nr:MAG: hypothetical protein E6G92_04265 [Alphaproteobacteria bacterium]